LRRRLRSAERRNDDATRLGSSRVKTPLSRVSASLCSVTCRDQRRPACFDLGFFRAALLRLWVLRGALRPRLDTLCAVAAISDKPGWAETGSSRVGKGAMSNTFRYLAFAASCLLLAPIAAAAQTYPSRQITLIVPFAPGGPADFLGRLVGQKMGEDLGQQIVVDNRPGANTIIGAQAVAKAAPDGYTLLMAIDGTLVMNPFLYTKLAYDPFRDFVPVSLLALVPSALVGNIDIPVNSIKELVDQEKAKPGTFQIGISTPTSQVNVGLLNMMAGTNFGIVPYRGGTTQITGILAGDIPLGMESINVARPLWRDKRLKILGLVSAQRLSLAPEIATIAETFPGYDLGIWQSIVTPAGTPGAVVNVLHAAIRKVLAMPEVREKLLAAGIEPASSATPQEFAAFIRSQADTRAKVIAAVGMKLD
jgi:tripartite-type tricarboxylate transporter receptor subunit TctC